MPGHPLAVGRGQRIGARQQCVERAARQQRSTRHDEAVDAVLHQFAVGRQVGQDRHAAVRHRLQHRHRHRVAARQAQVPARAAVALGLRSGVEPADEAHPALQPQGLDLRLQRAAQAAFVGHHQLPVRPGHGGKLLQHARRFVQRLEAPVGEEERVVLGGARRRQGLEAEGEDHHLARPQLAHARGHDLRVAGGQGTGAQHATRQRAQQPAARGTVQDVAAPGRADDARAQAPAALRRPGQRAVRGEVVGVDPVGIDLAQPARQPRQLQQQRRVAAGGARPRLQRQAARGRNAVVEAAQEAAARCRPQLQARHRGQAARPLQQVRAVAVTQQHQPHGAGCAQAS